MTAGNIPYMKVYTLPKSRYSGFKDRLTFLWSWMTFVILSIHCHEHQQRLVLYQ